MALTFSLSRFLDVFFFLWNISNLLSESFPKDANQASWKGGILKSSDSRTLGRIKAAHPKVFGIKEVKQNQTNQTWSTMKHPRKTIQSHWKKGAQLPPKNPAA